MVAGESLQYPHLQQFEATQSIQLSGIPRVQTTHSVFRQVTLSGAPDPPFTHLQSQVAQHCPFLGGQLTS